VEIILDLNGWKKVEDVPRYLLDRGVIEVSILPPLDLSINSRKAVKVPEGKIVTFYSTGERESTVGQFLNLSEGSVNNGRER